MKENYVKLVRSLAAARFLYGHRVLIDTSLDGEPKRSVNESTFNRRSVICAECLAKVDKSV